MELSQPTWFLEVSVGSDDKHGNTCGKHGDGCDCNNNPTQAGTGLTLHEFLVGRNDENADQQERSQQTIDDRSPVERLDGINANEIQGHADSR